MNFVFHRQAKKLGNELRWYDERAYWDYHRMYGNRKHPERSERVDANQLRWS